MEDDGGMKLNIRGEKLTITEAMTTHVESKLSKLERYFENPDNININAVVKVRNQVQKIEVTAITDKFTLRAEEEHSDFYAAVDLVIDKLERQIRKNKTKLENKYRNKESIGFAFDYEVEAEEEEAAKIVKRKNIEMKPMDEEEAILQAELLNHDFYVFKNIDEECISVVYKRKDGYYGIINGK